MRSVWATVLSICLAAASPNNVRGQDDTETQRFWFARSFPASIAEKKLYENTNEVGPLPKIIGGQNAAASQFPWQVALVLSGTPKDDPFHGAFCGGSIHGSRWILTAAHCTYKDNPNGKHLPAVKMQANEIDVYLGSHNFKDGVLVAVKSIIRHDGYVPSTQDNDITLLELNSEISTSNIKSIEIVQVQDETNLEPGKYARVVGWGSTVKGSIPSDQREMVKFLKHVKVDFQASKTCNEHHFKHARDVEEEYQKSIGKTDTQIKALLNKWYPPGTALITENMICAGTGDGSGDSCFGDSGGPLVISKAKEYLQAGIVSWGPYQACGLTNLFGVYTRLSNYRDWIAQRAK